MGLSLIIPRNQVKSCLCSFIAKTPKTARSFYQRFQGGNRLIEKALLTGRKGPARNFFGEVVLLGVIFRITVTGCVL